MSKLYSFATVLITLVLLSACGSSGRNAVSELPPVNPSSQNTVYRLGTGDTVRVNVWKNPDLSVEVPVRPDGFISVPLVGDVRAGGRTTSEIARETEAQLQQFIRTPQVSIIVTNLVSNEFLNRVRVVGAVAEPKSISHRDGMTVLDLVLEAGGLTDFASAQNAKLYRKTDGETLAYSLFLRSILEDGLLDTNYVLAPGDVVSIPERRF